MNDTKIRPCACGCGGSPKVSLRNDQASGYRIGVQREFMSGHHMRNIDRTPLFVRRYEVSVATGCWEWIGTTNKGYGVTKHNGVRSAAHRVSYEMYKGSIPNGYQVDHLCKNTICVNPNHLEAVTPQENNRRSESRSAVNARKTHCARGHEFTPENTAMDRGKRACRECDRARSRMKYLGRKAEMIAVDFGVEL